MLGDIPIILPSSPQRERLGGETPNCRLEILRQRSSSSQATGELLRKTYFSHPLAGFSPSAMADNVSHETRLLAHTHPPTHYAYTYNRNFPNKSLSPRVTSAIGVEPFNSTSWLFINVAFAAGEPYEPTSFFPRMILPKLMLSDCKLSSCENITILLLSLNDTLRG